MLKYVVILSYNKYLKSSQLVRTGVTEVNDIKSRANFFTLYFH